MIAMLRGAVAHRGSESAVIDVAGVGYLVHMPSNVLTEIGEGEEVLPPPPLFFSPRLF